MYLFTGALTAGVLLLLVMLRVAIAGIRASGIPSYWKGEAERPPAENAFRLVALGDSAVQGIGAGHPCNGLVGRIAGYVRERTGRPVHVVNVSEGGATVQDILERQLSKVNLRKADLVVISSSNDMQKRRPVETYEQHLNTLIRKLFPGKTIISDLPLWPGRAKYQAVLEGLTDAEGVGRADFAAVFREKGRTLRIFSWLPPHLNDRGYMLWFEAFLPGIDKVLGNALNCR